MFHTWGMCWEDLCKSAPLPFPCVCFTLWWVAGFIPLKPIVYQKLRITQLSQYIGRVG